MNTPSSQVLESSESMPQGDSLNSHQPPETNDLCPTDIADPDEVDVYALPTSKITKPAPHIEPTDVRWFYQPPFRLQFPHASLPPSLEGNPVSSGPPSAYTYPKAPIYSLRQDDWRFQGGHSYSAPFFVQDKANHHKSLLTKTPPGTHPTWNSESRKFCFKPIESMIPMPLGIPFGVTINGDERRFVTTACCHSLESLKAILSSERYARVKAASDTLWDLSWGYDGNTPIYRLPGLKRNMRSGIPDDPESPDGSYSFAVVQEQGRGRGTISPAVQANGVEAKACIATALEAMNTLYQEIVPLCLTKAEWEVTQFHDTNLNVFSAGGLSPGPTSVQGNFFSLASLGGDLGCFIGKVQGCWHVDKNDHWARWTLLILYMRLPPGSDMGLFSLLVLAFTAVLIGTAPSVNADAKEEFLSELAQRYNNVDEINRCAYVLYPNFEATERTSPVVVSAPTGLGNDLVTNGQDDHIHNFTHDGIPALGHSSSHLTRIAWELHYRNYNVVSQINRSLHLSPPITDNLMGKVIEIPPPPLDPVRDREKMKMRGHYHDSNDYYMRMTKAEFANAQRQAKEASLSAPDAQPNSASQSSSSVVPHSVGTSTVTPSTWAAPRNLERQGVSDLTEPSDGMQSNNPDLPTHSHSLRSQSRSEAMPESFEHSGHHDSDRVTESCLKRPRRAPSRHTQASSNVVSIPEPCYSSSDEGGSSTPPPWKRKKSNVQKTCTTTHPVPILPQPTSPILRDSSLAENEYQMSFIIDEDKEDESFLVRFSGYSAAHNEWVFETAMDAPDLIEEYRASLDPERVAHARSEIAGSDLVVETWSRLFDIRSIRQAADDISALCKALPSGPVSTIPLQSLTHSLTAESASLQSAAREFDDAGAVLTELRVQSIVCSLHVAQTAQLNADGNAGLLTIIKLALTLMSCRALLFLYRWHVVYGPLIASQLFNPDTPPSSFASLQSLKQTIQAFIEKHKQSPRQTGSGSRKLVIQASVLPEWLPSKSRTYEYVLPDSLGLTQPGNDRKACIMVFTQFISRHALLDSLKAMDTKWGRPNQGQEIEDIQSRALVRGGVLDALVEAFDNDGIFCAPGIDHVLVSPWLLFGKAKAKEIAQRITSKPDSILPLVRWLKLQCQRGEVQDICRQIARDIRFCVNSTCQIPLPPAISSRKPARKLKKRLIRIPEGPLHDLHAFHSFFVRFCLAKRRKLPCFNSSLRRILNGQHPTTSSHSKHDVDHVDPVRACNRAQTLLEESLSDALSSNERNGTLYSTWGLSNLLVRLGTGQGSATEEFIHNHLSQWFTSAKDCANVFEAVAASNQSSSTPMSYFNASCWGQYCDQLSLKNSTRRKDGIQGRIDDFFSDHVQQSWKSFLAEQWQNADASTPLPSFKQALALGSSIRVDGFGEKSLTNLQLANTLALLGVCQHPTVEEIAAVAFNLKKGALTGLSILGYNGEHNLESVTQAFRCVYDFLDMHLSTDDKKVLHFGTIFLEHILCKLVRWCRKFPDLDSLCKHGSNELQTFPLPLVVDRACLHAWMHARGHC
ncbi:hypothetical protein AAF712_008802 [Marasmius tenuissimus]|uniref:Uncharacterized protein n=1 Tax=Marasmius tenuissimus TaxID=585030 RepID=A0ABR2ZT01_9AGAR